MNIGQEKQPELVVEWHDELSPARGWLVINSLKNGAAGGGTRVRPGCTKEEVIDLARTMEIKFRISGPAIGGAKSGIDYDYKNESDKQQILKRWFKYIEKYLRTCYGTGGDQNVDQIKDVFPLLEEMGIRHPQEGIVRGFYSKLSKDRQEKIIDGLVTGVKLPIKNDKFLNKLNYTISDAATGYGVVSALRSLLRVRGEGLEGKRAVIEGFGNVGRGAAYYLTCFGAKVTAVYEKDWLVCDQNGLNISSMISGVIQKSKYGSDQYPSAEIFIPASTSKTVDIKKLVSLKSTGVKYIVCGSNNPFNGTEAEEYADKYFMIVPDFVANAGMARVYAYLLKENSVISEDEILADIDKCMNDAVVGSVSLEKENSVLGEFVNYLKNKTS